MALAVFMKLLKARLHRRFLSRNSMQFVSRRSRTKLQGPFTQAIFVAQLNAICVAPKLHQVSNMFETWCNFGATKIASSCATKIACVNGPLKGHCNSDFYVLGWKCAKDEMKCFLTNPECSQKVKRKRKSIDFLKGQLWAIFPRNKGKTSKNKPDAFKLQPFASWRSAAKHNFSLREPAHDQRASSKKNCLRY